VVENEGQSLTLRDYVNTLLRWKWVIVLIAVIVPLIAYFLTARRAAVYEASAQVLINRQNLALQLQGINDPNSSTSGFLLTQAALARVPVVARRAVAAAHVKRDASQLLGGSSVTASDTNDLLTFSVRDHQPTVATKLAEAYVHQFVIYANSLQDRDLSNALGSLGERINALEAAGRTDSPIYKSLVRTEEQLRTLDALQASRALVVRDAGGASKIAPNPKRAEVVGIVFGIVLGLVVAFLAEALDTRVRSEDKLRSALQMPLLGRLGRPRSTHGSQRLAMLEMPLSAEAEAFRILATNVELAAVDADATTIMVTSALPREGKTTTAANLAIALASQGRRVILVDLDLQAPVLHRLFNVKEQVGVTDIAVGRATPGQALVPIEIPEYAVGVATGVSPVRYRPLTISQDTAIERVVDHHGDGRGGGTLHLLSAGTLPVDNARFLSAAAITETLESLHGRSDVILIDSPPLLLAGAAVALTAQVEGVIAVCKLKVLNARPLAELKRVLDGCPARKLGFVVTNFSNPSSYGDAGRYTRPKSSLTAVGHER
jgi:polysaccharide biosynthesis transport protein